jgi:hypothetical protein
MTILVGYLADRTQQRGLFNIGASIVGMIGFSILIGAESASARYVGTFLGAIGIYPCVANSIAWVSNNVEGKHLLFFLISRSPFTPPIISFLSSPILPIPYANLLYGQESTNVVSP